MDNKTTKKIDLGLLPPFILMLPLHHFSLNGNNCNLITSLYWSKHFHFEFYKWQGTKSEVLLEKSLMQTSFFVQSENISEALKMLFVFIRSILVFSTTYFNHQNAKLSFFFLLFFCCPNWSTFITISRRFFYLKCKKPSILDKTSADFFTF